MCLCWRDELTLRGALGQGISPRIFGPACPTTQHLRLHHSCGHLNYAYCKGEAYFSITSSTGFENKDYSWQQERRPRVEVWFSIQRHHRHLWLTHIRHQPTRTRPDLIDPSASGETWCSDQICFYDENTTFPIHFHQSLSLYVMYFCKTSTTAPQQPCTVTLLRWIWSECSLTDSKCYFPRIPTIFHLLEGTCLARISTFFSLQLTLLSCLISCQLLCCLPVSTGITSVEPLQPFFK